MSLKIKKTLLPLLIILVAIAISFGIINSKPEVKKRSHHKDKLAVEVVELKGQSWSATIKTQGTVEARTLTTLISRVSGEVIWVSDELRPGGFFEKGDELLKIDPIDYQLEIKSVEAELAEARFVLEEEQAQASQAMLNWKRLGREEKPGDLVLRKPQLAKAKAVVESAKAKLQRARLDLKRTVVRAPYAGRVLEQYVDIGQFVSSGNNLVRLFAIDRVEVRLPLTDKQRELLDLPRYYRGESVTTVKNRFPIKIMAKIGATTHPWKGQFSRLEGTMSRDTRQQYIVAEIDNPYQRSKSDRPPLEVGQFVRAEINGRKLDGLFIIPRSAVHGENEVMIIDSENRIQRRQVTVLWEEESSVVIRDGLNDGDQLCTSYVPFAANNTVVRLLNGKEVTKNKATRHGGGTLKPGSGKMKRAESWEKSR